MTLPTPSILSARAVVKSYGNSPALRGVSAEIAAGEIVAVTGPSGCGKSTLLYCLSGILTPEAGQVTYAGADVGAMPERERSRLRRRDFGVLFQFGQLVAEMSGAANVALPLLLGGARRREAHTAAMSWLERFGVAEVADARPGEMSGGQQQRVALARALVTEPRVLFADEPTGALDTLAGEQVLAHIVRVARDNGTAVVLVTHDAKVAAHADREIALRDGLADPTGLGLVDTGGDPVRAATLVGLAVTGTRTDRVRIALTVFGAAAAALGWLCAANVAAIGPAGGRATDDRYRSELLREAGLRSGVILTFVLLTIPVLALLGQCARLGAPARDRRVAAIRLAGATPGQAVAIGAGESAVAAAAGALVGLAAFLVLHTSLDRPDTRGQRALPTDVWPSPIVVAVVVLALPLLVGAVAAWMLRRVTTTPLGVVRRVRRRRSPGPWAGVLILVGVALLGVISPLSRYLTRHGHPGGLSGTTTTVLVYIGALSAGIGVALGPGWIAHQVGRLLRRFGPTAATQIAGARLVDDPWQGSRLFGVLIVSTLFAGGTAAMYGYFEVMERARIAGQLAFDRATGQDSGPLGDYLDTFYTSSTRLVGVALGVAALLSALGLLVSIVDAVVSRRRAYASLAATGVPRAVLVRSQLWQTLGVAAPTILVATAAGVALSRALTGGTVVNEAQMSFASPNPPASTAVLVPKMTWPVPIPWASLGLAVGVSLGAVLLTVGISLLFLRSATSVEELRTT